MGINSEFKGLNPSLANGQLDAQIFNTFITILYM